MNIPDRPGHFCQKNLDSDKTSGKRWTTLIASLVAMLFIGITLAAADAQEVQSSASNEVTNYTPKIHHPNIANVKLFAQNPEIVTPVGIAVAPDGRVFVQENHTHKRNAKYKGPKTDRILVFEDTNGDGVADKRSVFYEGHTFSTDLLFGPDGHLYVSTRWFIGRFLNAANLQKSEGEPEKLVTCETEGNYPHNGVGGLAIDPANPNWLSFGFGENLGADYAFVGSDGVRLKGGGEGGSTYRCRTDGTKMTRLSTGHWNAFGMAFDLSGNLFSTDNDPNATPPNRLLHIIPGADFGYEYRYGRSGRHPLVCWYGENPGTLGMIGALGEAACGLVPHGPGKLLSASWTDNRVDLHQLQPNGASFSATREPFLSGPDDFRPVHFSYSADRKFLYFTDWVKISYPVHGHGRIWRVEFKEPVELTPLARDTERALMTGESALKLLGSDDPYLRTQAIHTLQSRPNVLKGHSWQNDSNATARAHYAVAMKRLDSKGNSVLIPDLLGDDDAEVRFVGIKWIADEDRVDYQSNLEALLNRADLTRRDLRAVVAALAKIGKKRKGKKEFLPDDTLFQLAMDEGKPSQLRAMALETINVSYKQLTVDVLARLTQSSHEVIRREAIRSLAIHPDAGRGTILAKLASNQSLDAQQRADAIAGLASMGNAHAELLNRLVNEDDPVISSETRRTLASANLIQRDLEEKPKIENLPKWQSLVDQASGEPDLNVGRRLFFHAKLGGCYKCHAMNGRGNSVGPDLTTIKNQSDITRDWMLEHIVNPNAEMAPYYRPQQLLTIEGQVFTGLVVGQEGQKQAYVASDGSVFFVDKNDVEERQELSTSIMPSGLLDALTADEIRDLIAYLLADQSEYSSQPGGPSQSPSKNKISNQMPQPVSPQLPTTQEELMKVLDLSDDQVVQLRQANEQRQKAVAEFEKLSGEKRRDAQREFFKQRKTKLQTIFDERQWNIWSTFWNRNRN